MRSILMLCTVMAILNRSYACNAHEMVHHEMQMQHGFVLSDEDRFASHLVASGHHSWQAEVTGFLIIEDSEESEIYARRKASNTDGSKYFLFQAQNLDLPNLVSGQILTGHIVEARVGKYEPKNVLIKEAKFKIEKVLLNIENPFFGEEWIFRITSGRN